jgi:outer membrane protein assembly factor BamA
MRWNPLVLVGLLLTASPAFAQGAGEGVGRCLTPDSIAVRGERRVSAQTIVSAAGIATGETLNFPAVQRVIRDVYATGDFDAVTVTCDLDGPRNVLVIGVAERATSTAHGTSSSSVSLSVRCSPR